MLEQILCSSTRTSDPDLLMNCIVPDLMSLSLPNISFFFSFLHTVLSHSLYLPSDAHSASGTLIRYNQELGNLALRQIWLYYLHFVDEDIEVQAVCGSCLRSLS